MKKILSTIVVISGFLASIVALVQYYNDNTLVDLSGEWIIEDKIIKGPYKNSVILFKVFIIQKGTIFSGEAEKIFYNGEKVLKSEKSRLKLVNGIVENSKIRVNFIEQGKNRETRGQFLWDVINSKKLVGTFSSSTESRGISVLYRQ